MIWFMIIDLTSNAGIERDLSSGLWLNMGFYLDNSCNHYRTAHLSRIVLRLLYRLILVSLGTTLTMPTLGKMVSFYLNTSAIWFAPVLTCLIDCGGFFYLFVWRGPNLRKEAIILCTRIGIHYRVAIIGEFSLGPLGVNAPWLQISRNKSQAVLSLVRDIVLFSIHTRKSVSSVSSL